MDSIEERRIQIKSDQVRVSRKAHERSIQDLRSQERAIESKRQEYIQISNRLRTEVKREVVSHPKESIGGEAITYFIEQLKESKKNEKSLRGEVQNLSESQKKIANLWRLDREREKVLSSAIKEKQKEKTNESIELEEEEISELDAILRCFDERSPVQIGSSFDTIESTSDSSTERRVRERPDGAPSDSRRDQEILRLESGDTFRSEGRWKENLIQSLQSEDSRSQSFRFSLNLASGGTLSVSLEAIDSGWITVILNAENSSDLLEISKGLPSLMRDCRAKGLKISSFKILHKPSSRVEDM